MWGLLLFLGAMRCVMYYCGLRILLFVLKNLVEEEANKKLNH